MRILREGQIKAGLYDLAALADVPIEDLKTEFEKVVEGVSGRNATFLGDDSEMNMQVQTMALAKLYRSYKKPRQWIKFLDAQTTEEAKPEEMEEAEEEE